MPLAFRPTLCRAFVLLLALACAAPVFAQPETILDDPEVKRLGQEGLDLVYGMRFDEARLRFDTIELRHPEHPIGPFLHALEAWWQILVDFEDESRDAAFFDAMKEVERRADRMLRRDENDFDAQFFKAAALGFRGRHRSNRGAWFRASRDGYEALDYVFAVAEYDELNADFGFGKGVYDYFAWAVPRKYPVAKPFMGLFPRGDRGRGLAALERTAAEGTFIRTEAAYFLFQIHSVYEPDYDASLRLIAGLHERHPGNPLFHALLGRTHARWGRWDEGRATFEGVLERYRAGRAGYGPGIAEPAFYFLARERMVRGAYTEALAYLGQLDVLTARHDDATYYRAMGRLRKGMCLDALGHRSAAQAQYRAVLAMDEVSRSHDRAERYLKRPYGG